MCSSEISVASLLTSGVSESRCPRANAASRAAARLTASAIFSSVRRRATTGGGQQTFPAHCATHGNTRRQVAACGPSSGSLSSMRMCDSVSKRMIRPCAGDSTSDAAPKPSFVAWISRGPGGRYGASLTFG
jgi:hypothetical protein